MKLIVVAFVACFLQLNGVHGANPNYSYHVKIDDPAHVNAREKSETRKGEDTKGFYSVSVPSGYSYKNYLYGHPQTLVPVQSTGPAAVYGGAQISDTRLQIVDKSNLVVVPQPLRQVAPVLKAEQAYLTQYASSYAPPPTAYLPPPQYHAPIAVQKVISQPAPVVVAAPPPQILSVQKYVAPPPPVVQKVVRQQIALPIPQPQVFTIPQPPPPAISLVDLPPPPSVLVKQVRPAKVLTVPAASPAVSIVKDSYSEPPRDTFRDPSQPSYPDAIKPAVVKELNLEYGAPSAPPPSPPRQEYGLPATTFVPGTPLGEVKEVKVRVVQPKVKVVQPVVKQVVQQVALPPPQVFVQKVVAAPPPAIAVQTAAPVVNPGLYSGAIGFHTVNSNPGAYVHSYGTQGFQVTSSRQFNKPIFPAVQKIVQPAPLYGPPEVQVQKVVQSSLAYLPPPVAVQKVVEPVVSTQYVQAAPIPQIHQYVQAPPVVAAPLPQPVAVQAALPAPVLSAAPVKAVSAGPVLSFTGKKMNPLTFEYNFDNGAGAKVSHSYSGSGW